MSDEFEPDAHGCRIRWVDAPVDNQDFTVFVEHADPFSLEPKSPNSEGLVPSIVEHEFVYEWNDDTVIDTDVRFVAWEPPIQVDAFHHEHLSVLSAVELYLESNGITVDRLLSGGHYADDPSFDNSAEFPTESKP